MAETIQLDSHDIKSFEETLEKAESLLSRGEVILYPTDTVYGLGADATDVRAIGLINDIKRRSAPKPMLVIVSDIAMAQKYGKWNDVTEQLASAFWPGPLTLVIPKATVLPDLLTAGSQEVGVRVPNHAFCRELVRRFGKPIVSTSANVTGEKQPETLDTILKQFGIHSNAIRLAVEENRTIPALPSTVVRVADNKYTVLREGVITKETLDAAFSVK